MSDTAKKFSDELRSAAKNWITNELEKMLQEERGHEESMRHGRGRVLQAVIEIVKQATVDQCARAVPDNWADYIDKLEDQMRGTKEALSIAHCRQARRAVSE
jgi:hypothetical protein